MRKTFAYLMASLLTISPAAATDAPRDAANIFVSGHSLTDNPLPPDLARVAESLGTPMRWNRHYVVGSSIRGRSRGLAPGETGWPGYKQGYNRDGEGMDVVAELREPKTLGGQRYDTLLITEQHGVLSTLMWNDTVRYLRHYHDRFIEGNAAGRTYFYESWLGLDDKGDPRRWIAYERAASPVWQCLATRINLSLAAEERTDRLTPLPAGIALAELVERATQGAGVAGVSAGTVRETVDRIVKDNVHLTRLGSYYMSLVSYAAIYRRSPVGAWAPAEVDATQAKSLQQLAADFITRYYANNVPLDLAACRSLMHRSFIAHYWTYTRDTYWTQEEKLSAPRAYWRWMKHIALWHYRVWRDDENNPLRYDAATDRGYWYPPP